MANFKLEHASRQVTLVRKHDEGKRNLIIVSPKATGDRPIIGYFEALLNRMLNYTDSTIGPWASVRVVAADRKLSKLAEDFEADAVCLLGKTLAETLIEPSKLKVKDGGAIAGLLVNWQNRRWIATPSLAIYGMGETANWQRASLLGQLYRHLELLKVGHVGGVDLSSNTYKIITSMKEWQRFYNILADAPVVAIDTETRNLEIIKGTTLTMQFCADGKVGYVLPIGHKDNAMSPKDTRFIIEELREYFEQGTQATHVFHTAKFDLHQILTTTKAKFYNHKVYDVCAGNFNLDENVMFRESAIGVPGYTLEHMALEYGLNLYEESPIAKADRSRIYALPLEQVAKYGAIDVVVPFRMRKMQLALAKYRDTKHIGKPYAKFNQCVTDVIGRQLLQFVFMERNGLLVDRKYLVEAQSPNSVFKAEIKAELEKLKQTPAMVKTNEVLLAKQGKGSNTLFGNTSWLLDLNKPAHKQVLFFDVLKLKPLAQRDDGGGKIDAKFQKHYKDEPVLIQYKSLEELKKLYSTFIVGLHKTLSTNPNSFDGRMRTTYKWLQVITGRASSADPNLQNIPTRSKRAKAIKRQFIATRGKLILKRDFSAHEIRGWGMVSKDRVLASTFWKGMQVRLKFEYKDTLSEEDRKAWDVKLKLADVHIQNYAMIYSVPPESVSKDNRNSVKATIFGSVYGLGLPALSANLAVAAVDSAEDKIKEAKKIKKEAKSKAELKDAKALYIKGKQELEEADNTDWEAKTKKIHKLVFKDKFPQGGAWLESTKEQGRETMRSVSPLGRVRHLYGHLHLERHLYGAMDRRGPNSNIQGACSDIGFIGGSIMREIDYKWFYSRGIDLGYIQCNAVHDSNESECDIVNIPIVEYLQMHSYTTLVHRWLKSKMDVDLLVGFEMDSEIGACQSALNKASHWQYMLEAIKKGIDWGNENLKWEIDTTRIMKVVERNATIVHDFRKREIKDQLLKGKKVNDTMLITGRNCLDIGLEFKNVIDRPTSVKKHLTKEDIDAM